MLWNRNEDALKIRPRRSSAIMSSLSLTTGSLSVQASWLNSLLMGITRSARSEHSRDPRP